MWFRGRETATHHSPIFSTKDTGIMLRTFARTARWIPAALVVLVAACSDDDGPGTDPTPPPPPPPPLVAPAGVGATAASATAITVSFTPSAGATTHRVERAQGAGGTFAQAGTTTTSPFNDTGLTPSTLYRYRVVAVRGTEEAASGEVQTTTQALQPGSSVVEVTADITTNTTWTANNTYLLKGFIHVANGATLTIEPGTVIQGDFNTLGSSLFVLRGSKIVANGTATQPIVFTSSQPVGQRQAGDWGGLIILGNGIINRAAPVILEGTGTDASNVAIDYAGGTDNTDTSGSLRFVRVEFAGFGPAPDAELNSFTFAAVGSGTVLENLQSLNGLDDAFEWFGGAVDGKNLVSYNSGDDHFDMSEGYVGRLQFLIAYQTRTVIPRPTAGNISSDPQGIENDGCNGANCTNGQNSLPLTAPLIANFTLVGPPSTVTSSSGGIGMMLRRGTAGTYINGVTARWSRAGISLRDQSTLDRIASGELRVSNVAVAESPVIFQPQTGSTVQGTVDAGTNSIQDLLATTSGTLFTTLPGTEPAGPAGLDWSPAAGSPLSTGGLSTFTGPLATKAGTFVQPTTYRGAAGPGEPKWWSGWTNFAVN